MVRQRWHFRGACFSGHWPMQVPRSFLSRCSVSEVLQLYVIRLWILSPNAFAVHLLQQHWQSSWKYFSFLARPSQQFCRSVSWNPQPDSRSMLSKTLKCGAAHKQSKQKAVCIISFRWTQMKQTISKIPSLVYFLFLSNLKVKSMSTNDTACYHYLNLHKTWDSWLNA